MSRRSLFSSARRHLREKLRGRHSNSGLGAGPNDAGQISAKGKRTEIDLLENDRELIDRILNRGFSMCSFEDLAFTAQSVRWVIKNSVPGDIVECGTGKGGHGILAAGIIRDMGSDKKIFIFDTFTGMTTPEPTDFRLWDGELAETVFESHKNMEQNTEMLGSWLKYTRQEVETNFDVFGLVGDNIVFVEGDVAETLQVPSNIPVAISFLRLDTDWEASTKTELEGLFPRLVPGGVLVVDDYFYWHGQQKAVDEYFAARGFRPLLARVGSDAVFAQIALGAKG
jgi:O-methyltransferase